MQPYLRIFARLLAFGQLAMLLRQFALGFVPGVTEPQRVPFSWDMFATRVERCNLLWQPPIAWSSTLTFGNLAALNAPLEWQVVFDTRHSYRQFALQICQRRQQPTRVSMQCYLPDGTQSHATWLCP